MDRLPKSKELVAGFWLWQVKSMEEAIECSARSFDDTEVEIRQVFEAEDFGAEFIRLREQEERLRAQMGKK